MKILIADKTADECRSVLEKYDGIEVTVKTGMAPEDLIEKIKGYEGLIVRSATRVTREVILSGALLKVIGRAGAGVDNIDVKAAAEKGVLVMNTPGGNSSAVAELVIGLMFALARNIARADASMKAGKWEKKSLMGTELSGKTLGLLGIGNVGSKVAEKASALGMKILAFDPYIEPAKADDFKVSLVDLNRLLQTSDYISLHMPRNSETNQSVNKEFFAKMKKGVGFINCSRGGIVVEKDMLEALEQGIIAAAGVDVYEKEPPDDMALVRHQKVTATPHIGASSKEAQVTVAVMIAEQIGAYLTTGEVVNSVTP